MTALRSGGCWLMEANVLLDRQTEVVVSSEPEAPPGIRLAGITKRYGKDGPVAVDDVDLEIRDGEFMVLVGPSGCGKSTLLKLIAGIEETSAGMIEIGGRDVTHLDPRRRDIAMVFQNYALYPHLTVRGNLGF